GERAGGWTALAGIPPSSRSRRRPPLRSGSATAPRQVCFSVTAASLAFAMSDPCGETADPDRRGRARHREGARIQPEAGWLRTRRCIRRRAGALEDPAPGAGPRPPRSDASRRAGNGDLQAAQRVVENGQRSRLDGAGSRPHSARVQTARFTDGEGGACSVARAAARRGMGTFSGDADENGRYARQAPAGEARAGTRPPRDSRGVWVSAG